MNKGELTRERIVAQAAPIFNQRGFAGCSMQDVMDATGLEKGGLYRHFESKEELAAEAFKYALRQAVKTRTADLEHITGAVAKLRYVVTRFVEAPSAIPGGCPLMNTAIDSDDGNPALRKLVRAGLSDWKKRISTLVEQGIQSREIRKDIEPRKIANTIIATLEGALMISRMEGTKEALTDAGAALNNMLDTIISVTPKSAYPTKSKPLE
jgi:TetR/AcrR family transcriptional regulator, transcriptional repressor for nem operon